MKYFSVPSAKFHLQKKRSKNEVGLGSESFGEILVEGTPASGIEDAISHRHHRSIALAYYYY
jgi:hypothetical protein